MKEIWKPIKGCKGYEVSNLGRIKSLAKTWKFSNRLVNRKERIFKCNPGANGYPMIHIFKKPLYVHHLVSYAFIGRRPKGCQIDHIDGDRANNKSTNLRYVTCLGNWEVFLACC